MPVKKCERCGEPYATGRGRPSPRCPKCRSTLYGANHQHVRAATIADAVGGNCTRCGGPLLEGQLLDLDHRDDLTGYAGYAHAGCNRSAGATKGNLARIAGRNGHAAPVVCRFHDPVTSSCPHSRDW